MHKCLVTVGTSSFEPLIKYLDCSNIKNVEFIFQIGKTPYKPVNFKWFEYIPDINEILDDFDLIITHAGAGSVYENLEKKRKLIVVPNLNRVDSHQLELARFVESNNYCLVCYDIQKLSEVINGYFEAMPKLNIYNKVDFFRFDDILNKIKS